MSFLIVDSVDNLGEREFALLRFRPLILGVQVPHYYYAGVMGKLFACRGSKVIGADLEFWEPWFVTPYEEVTAKCLEEAMLDRLCEGGGWRWLSAAEVASERARQSEYLHSVGRYESTFICAEAK